MLSRSKTGYILAVISMITSTMLAHAKSDNPVDKYGFPYKMLDQLLKSRQESLAMRIIDRTPKRAGDEDDRALWRFACLANTQDFERAKEALSHIKSFDCATAHTLVLAGNTYVQLQEFERSLYFLNLAIKRDPTSEDGYSARADANNALKRYEEAVKDLEAAAKFAPARQKEFYAKAGVLLTSLGQTQRALNLMDKADNKSALLSDASFLLAKAACLTKLKRDKDAAAVLTQGIDICKHIQGRQKDNSEYVMIRLLQEREKVYRLLNRLDDAKADHEATEKISKRLERDFLGEH